MLWNKKKKVLDKQIEVAEQIRTARAGQNFADQVIARVQSQNEEVTQITNRLETRKQRNHFGEALQLSMQKRR